jgi:hypothetical protein
LTWQRVLLAVEERFLSSPSLKNMPRSANGKEYPAYPKQKEANPRRSSRGKHLGGDPKERKQTRADQGGKREDIYILAIKNSVQKCHQIITFREG